jgi:hypothetical protein
LAAADRLSAFGIEYPVKPEAAPSLTMQFAATDFEGPNGLPASATA